MDGKPHSPPSVLASGASSVRQWTIISNAKSKTRIRYTDAGTRLFDTVTSKPAASRR